MQRRLERLAGTGDADAGRKLRQSQLRTQSYFLTLVRSPSNTYYFASEAPIEQEIGSVPIITQIPAEQEAIASQMLSEIGNKCPICDDNQWQLRNFARGPYGLEQIKSIECRLCRSVGMAIRIHEGLRQGFFWDENEDESYVEDPPTWAELNISPNV